VQKAEHKRGLDSKDSDEGVQHLGLLSFWTFSIAQYSKEHRVSETECFHPQVSPTPSTEDETDPVSEMLCSSQH
jgi:hypothetical protein